MKIALLTNGIYPFVIGGIQKHSFYTVKGLAQKQIYVDVYHLSDDSNLEYSDYFTQNERDFITFYTLPFPKLFKFPGHYVVSNFLHSKNLYNEIRKEEYDFIYAQGFTSWYFLKKDKFRKDLIANLHGLEMFQYQINWKHALGSRLLRIPAKYIIKYSKNQISLGGKLTDIFYTHGAKKESVIEVPNGIDQKWLINKDNIKTSSTSPIRFVFVGRNERRKGIIEILSAIKELINEDEKFKFDFIGIDQLDLIKSDQLEFHGEIRNEEQIKTILDESDVLVCPSYSEGMPTVILEAMSRGCAIIGTDVGAVSQLVADSNGYLIKEPINENLVHSLRLFIKMNHDELQEKKKKSLEKIRNKYTWDQVIETLLEEATDRLQL